MDLPDNIGIMVLPHVVLLPHSIVPLHIFELRYRQMLQTALDGHRMFALCLDVGPGQVPLPARCGGVGLIRACVQHKDGTSNLILQGTHRVYFEDFSAARPFYTGKPTALPLRHPVDNLHARQLAAQVLRTVRELPCCKARLPAELSDFLTGLKDYHTLVDIVAGSFIRCTRQKQQILESEDMELRLTLLTEALRKERLSNC